MDQEQVVCSEKVKQAMELLNEQKIDAWLMVTSEDGDAQDPVYRMIFGEQDLSRGILLLTRSGEQIMILPGLDAEIPRQSGNWRVIPVNNESEMQHSLITILSKIDPQVIALNFSEFNTKADGLTFGMYLWLKKTLQNTPYFDRFKSSEKLVSKLRNRKTTGEVNRIRFAVKETEKIFDRMKNKIRIGMTGEQIHAMILEEVKEKGFQTAWSSAFCPVVTVGPVKNIGHTPPSNDALMPGWLLHIDFGVKVNGYCGDIQRMFYALKPGETEAPQEVIRMFSAVREGVDSVIRKLLPGNNVGDPWEAAGQVMLAHGLQPPLYTVGHQLGRAVHDGKPSLKQYPPDFPGILIEAGNVFTAEGVENKLDEYGWMSLEDDVLVTENGPELLNNQQAEIWLIKK